MGDGRQARFLFLPDGEDPDSLVRREGREIFEKAVASALSFSGYFYDTLAAATDMNSLDGRSRLVELARPLLGRLQPGAFRHMMLDELARRVRMAPADLLALPGYEEMRPASGGVSAVRRPRQARSGMNGVRPSLMRKVIAMLLHAPGLAACVDDMDMLAGLEVAGMPLLVRLLEMLHERPHLSMAQVLEHWRDTEEGRYLEKLSVQESLIERPEALEAEFRDALQRLLRQSIEQRIDQLGELAGHRGWHDEEKDEMRRLQKTLLDV